MVVASYWGTLELLLHLLIKVKTMRSDSQEHFSFCADTAQDFY